MAIESATYVSQLVNTNPGGGDNVSTADDHIRLIKATLVTTFTDLRKEVSASAGEMNYLRGVTSNIQTQLNTLSSAASTMVQAASSTLQTNMNSLSATLQTMINAGGGNPTAETSAGLSIAVNWQTSNRAHVNLMQASASLSFTNPVYPGDLSLKLLQGGAGTKRVNWPTSVKWNATPTLSTTAGAVDIISFYFDGSAYYGSVKKGF